jgi:hypothetical protein
MAGQLSLFIAFGNIPILHLYRAIEIQNRQGVAQSSTNRFHARLESVMGRLFRKVTKYPAFGASAARTSEILI